jgi:shikimate dehydrogenase
VAERGPVRLVLLGDPVAHSRSPQIHEAALRSAGLDGEYLALKVDDTGFRRECERVGVGHWSGANVTMPFKTAAADLCELMGDEARRCGAVNVLIGRDGRLAGENTDASAIRRLADRVADDRVLLLGAGGAAAAALVALEGMKIRVAARRRQAAEDLVASIGAEAQVIPWGEADKALVVNATPLGMGGESLPEGVMDAATGLIDLPYGTTETPAVAEAASRGIPAFDGIDVLVAQAADAFRIWTGLEPDIEAMRSAARRA